MNWKIAVVSRDDRENPLLREAECVYREINSAVIEALPGIVKEGKKTVFLASGDPLLCGIGATLRKYVPPEELLIVPGVTAFQKLFARLGEPWEKMRFFSVHGRKEPLPHRNILRCELAVVYGDRERPARELARELLEAWPEAAERAVAWGCNLGLPEEYVKRGTLGELAADGNAAESLSLLALLPDNGFRYPPLSLGLPDESYSRYRNMITHPEIRAVVLSKLRLAPGVLWDIGAGSGSVGIEAAQLCETLEVAGVERNPERFAELEANLRSAGVPRYSGFCGSFPGIAPSLPRPDRIFIGGGGAELGMMLRAAFEYLKPGGRMVATGVLAETVAVLCTVLKEHRRELLTLNISRTEALGESSLFRAENPITIAVWEKAK